MQSEKRFASRAKPFCKLRGHHEISGRAVAKIDNQRAEVFAFSQFFVQLLKVRAAERAQSKITNASFKNFAIKWRRCFSRRGCVGRYEHQRTGHADEQTCQCRAVQLRLSHGLGVHENGFQKIDRGLDIGLA